MGYIGFPFLPMNNDSNNNNVSNNKSIDSIDVRQYPSHEEVQIYLENYALHSGIINQSYFDNKNDNDNNHNSNNDITLKLGTVVNSITPQWKNTHDNSDKTIASWLVETKPNNNNNNNNSDTNTNNKSDTYSFDAIVVANGHYRRARFPFIEGLDHAIHVMNKDNDNKNNDRLLVVHSHDYRTPDMFFGRKKVIVIGHAASG